MKSSKYKYKLAIMHAIKSFENRFSDDLLQDLICKDYCSFWKIKNHKNPVSASNINGLVEDMDIAEHFRSKFSDVSSTTVAFDSLCHTAYTASMTDYIFDVELVDSVISTRLKCGKAPGIDSLTAEHFVNAHPSVVVHLTRLFNLILKHGYVPNAFGYGIVVPIIKDKYCDICSSDNYVTKYILYYKVL